MWKVCEPGVVKTCRTCNKQKPRSEFYERDGTKDSLTLDCKECFKAAARDRYKATRATGHKDRGNWREDGRRCTGCTKWKPWEQYHRRAEGKNGRSARCMDCTNDAKLQYRAAKREEYRAADRDWHYRTGKHYRSRYGIDREQRDAMAVAQGGKCAACSKTPAKRLVVDHCHLCAKVRKLLCDRCNLAMHVLDEPGLLDLLLAYRDAHLADGCNPGD